MVLLGGRGAVLDEFAAPSGDSHESGGNDDHRRIVRSVSHGEGEIGPGRGAAGMLRNKKKRDEMILENLGFVKRLAFKFHRAIPDEVDLDDLISSGSIGLINAVDSFDESMGVPFRAHAQNRIVGEMLDFLRKNDWLSRQTRTRLKRIEAETLRLQSLFGRKPTSDELAECCRISREKVEEMAGVSPNRARLDLPYLARDGRVRDLKAAVADPRQNDPTERIERIDHFRRVVRGLRQQERLVVLLFYLDGLNQREIGKSLGLSESRVSQIHSAIIQRFRQQGTISEDFGRVRSPATGRACLT